MSGIIASINEIAGNVTPRKSASDVNAANFFDGRTVEEKAKDLEAEKARNGETGNVEVAKKGETETPKISIDKAKQTGVTNAYITTSILETIRGFVVFYKHYKHFTDEEKDLIAIANSKDSKTLTQKEIVLLQRSSKEATKYEIKKEKIRTLDRDMEMLTEGFTAYSQATGKTSSPNLILVSIITRYLANIGLDMLD